MELAREQKRGERRRDHEARAARRAQRAPKPRRKVVRERDGRGGKATRHPAGLEPGERAPGKAGGLRGLGLRGLRLGADLRLDSRCAVRQAARIAPRAPAGVAGALEFDGGLVDGLGEIKESKP